ncbi:MAG TPA: lysine 2,3-aminomutase, partial [Pseudolabrys sp.]|nr:lysine 2,3-aminomutase [Pseudolabrys sp.]
MTTLRTVTQLCEHDLVPPERRRAIEKVAARYAVALPEALAGLIDKNDRSDPIARQFVPGAA